jgi:hypothetical protein
MAPVRFPRRLCAAVVALIAFAGVAPSAGAQEVLFLHIRPHADTPGAAGSGGAALAAREAAWARSNARARIIIESVCTGCLAPWRPALAEEQRAGAPSSDPAPSAAPGMLAVALSSENPVIGGLEPDRPSGASGATSDPSTHERQP